jgi:mannose-1-phosphate guanylyltransferase
MPVMYAASDDAITPRYRRMSGYRLAAADTYVQSTLPQPAPHAHAMQWCIVVADDHGPEWAPPMGLSEPAAPVQYCGLGASRTLLQKALSRALELAPASNILVTAMRGFRSHWEPSVWFVRPEHRFVSDKRPSSSLAAAAAVLSIASRSPSDVVTIMPARCFVAHEAVLREGLARAVAMLRCASEGVVTVGMVDLDEGVDEHYLVVGRNGTGVGLSVHGYARQPVPWIARYLRQQGAVVGSGILVGYAGVFAAHISKHWPGLTQKLASVIASAAAAGVETRMPARLSRSMPNTVMRALRWHAPSLPQRAVLVRGCGWSTLNSARAVARVSEFAATGPGYDSNVLKAQTLAEECETEFQIPSATAREALRPLGP